MLLALALVRAAGGSRRLRPPSVAGSEQRQGPPTNKRPLSDPHGGCLSRGAVFSGAEAPCLRRGSASAPHLDAAEGAFPDRMLHRLQGRQGSDPGALGSRPSSPVPRSAGLLSPYAQGRPAASPAVSPNRRYGTPTGPRRPASPGDPGLGSPQQPHGPGLGSPQQPHGKQSGPVQPPPGRQAAAGQQPRAQPPRGLPPPPQPRAAAPAPDPDRDGPHARPPPRHQNPPPHQAPPPPQSYTSVPFVAHAEAHPRPPSPDLALTPPTVGLPLSPSNPVSPTSRTDLLSASAALGIDHRVAGTAFVERARTGRGRIPAAKHGPPVPRWRGLWWHSGASGTAGGRDRRGLGEWQGMPPAVCRGRGSRMTPGRHAPSAVQRHRLAGNAVRQGPWAIFPPSDRTGHMSPGASHHSAPSAPALWTAEMTSRMDTTEAQNPPPSPQLSASACFYYFFGPVIRNAPCFHCRKLALPNTNDPHFCDDDIAAAREEDELAVEDWAT